MVIYKQSWFIKTRSRKNLVKNLILTHDFLDHLEEISTENCKKSFF